MSREILDSSLLHKALKQKEPTAPSTIYLFLAGVCSLYMMVCTYFWLIQKTPHAQTLFVIGGIAFPLALGVAGWFFSKSDQEALFSSRQALAGMLSVFPCVVTDAKRQVLYANTLFKSFFPTIDEKGFGAVEETLPNDGPRAAFRKIWQKGLKGNVPFSSTQSFYLKNGRQEDIFVSVLPLAEPGIFLWRFLSINDFKQKFFRQHFEAEGFIKSVNLEDLFNSAPAGNVLLDREAHIQDWNRTFERCFCLDAPPTRGSSFLELLTPKDRDTVQKMLDKAYESDAPSQEFHCEARFLTGKEVVIYVGSFAHPSLEVDGEKERGIFLQAFDNTQVKQIHARVSQAQKTQALGQLAGGIAHDFNNLLTAMIGFCDLLLLRHAPNDPSFMDIMQIKQNANRAANLVRQLLAFSRQQTLQPKIMDISEILEDVSLLLQRLIGSSIKLSIFHGKELGYVRVDRGQLEQVIINLVVNARDALDGEGDITLKTKNVVFEKTTQVMQEIIKAGRYVCIEVKDTGMGMPSATLERIFDPFFSTKAVGSGTGLGLSTVQGIVSQTGGYVCVESAPGKGTTFYIYLPHYDKGIEAVPALQEKDVPLPLTRDLTGSGTILFVEDEDAVRLFSSRALRDKGYNVIEATTGEEGLNYLTTAWESGHEKVDLLITDVVMPVMDGPTLVKRAHELFPDLKVIFISGYAEDTFREKLTLEEELVFLPKPYTLKDLAGLAKSTLSQSPASSSQAKAS